MFFVAPESSLESLGSVGHSMSNAIFDWDGTPTTDTMELTMLDEAIYCLDVRFTKNRGHLSGSTHAQANVGKG